MFVSTGILCMSVLIDSVVFLSLGFISPSLSPLEFSSFQSVIAFYVMSVTGLVSFLCLWVYDSLAFPLSVEFSPWLPFSRARFLFYVLSGCEMIVLFCFSAPILTISPRICAFIPCPHCLRIVCVRELEHFVTIALFSLFFPHLNSNFSRENRCLLLLLWFLPALSLKVSTTLLLILLSLCFGFSFLQQSQLYLCSDFILPTPIHLAPKGISSFFVLFIFLHLYFIFFWWIWPAGTLYNTLRLYCLLSCVDVTHLSSSRIALVCIYLSLSFAHLCRISSTLLTLLLFSTRIERQVRNNYTLLFLFLESAVVPSCKRAVLISCFCTLE